MFPGGAGCTLEAFDVEGGIEVFWTVEDMVETAMASEFRRSARLCTPRRRKALAV